MLLKFNIYNAAIGFVYSLVLALRWSVRFVNQQWNLLNSYLHCQPLISMCCSSYRTRINTKSMSHINVTLDWNKTLSWAEPTQFKIWHNFLGSNFCAVVEPPFIKSFSFTYLIWLVVSSISRVCQKHDQLFLASHIYQSNKNIHVHLDIWPEESF